MILKKLPKENQSCLATGGQTLTVGNSRNKSCPNLISYSKSRIRGSTSEHLKSAKHFCTAPKAPRTATWTFIVTD